MVLADFRIFLVAPVGFPQLLTPAFLSALTAAIALASIARPANEKHQAATDRPAKQLSKRHFRRHCSQGGMDNDDFSWQPELHCCVVRLLRRSRHKQKPRPLPRSGFLFSASGLLL
jgi:hypothetical protein